MNEKELSRKDVESIYYKVRCYYEVKAKLYEDILKAQCTTIIQTETHQPFDYTLWETIETFNQYEHWLIRYKKLKSNGELDFIKKYKR